MHAFLKREWDWTVKFVPTFVWVKISWIQFVAYNIKAEHKSAPKSPEFWPPSVKSYITMFVDVLVLYMLSNVLIQKTNCIFEKWVELELEIINYILPKKIYLHPMKAI